MEGLIRFVRKGCQFKLGCQNVFSRMRSRRVLVLRLGVWGLGVDAKSVRSVRKRPQASAVCSQASAAENRREMQSCRRFWTRLWSSRLKSVKFSGIGGVVVAKRKAVVTFGLALRLRVSKVSTVTGIGGVVIAKRRTVVTFGLAAGERKGERRKER